MAEDSGRTPKDVAFSPCDRRFMGRALALARRGEGLVEPNPMVGAVLVKEGEVVGEGYHQKFGAPHAEIHALGKARGRSRGATLYVTLEPCAHHGKTPPCAPALAEAGVCRVVAAVLDPTLKTRERGVKSLAAAGVRVDVGLCRDQAIVLNAAFFKRTAVGLPLLVAKWALSADGKAATRTGCSRWISSPESRALVHRLRGRADAVLVGCGTARRDDPLLTCRAGRPRRRAVRVVLCGRSLPRSDSRLVQTANEQPVLIAYPENAPPAGLDRLVAAGCRTVGLPPHAREAGLLDLHALLRTLADQPWNASNVLVEGGAAALGHFFDDGLVDKVMVFVAPSVIGGHNAVGAVGGLGAETIGEAFDLVRCRWRRSGPDMLLEGWVRDPLTWAVRTN